MRVTEKHVMFQTGVLCPLHKTLVKTSGEELRGEFGKPPHKEGGLEFHNMEQMLLYIKALAFGDNDTMSRIYDSETQKDARYYGRRVSGFDSSAWGIAVVHAVRFIVGKLMDQDEKFLKTVMSEDFKGKLFVYCNPRDRVLGNGLPVGADDADDQAKWHGRNILGQALTESRDAWKHRMEQNSPMTISSRKSIFMSSCRDALGKRFGFEEYFFGFDLYDTYERNLSACGLASWAAKPRFWSVARMWWIDVCRTLRGMKRMDSLDVLMLSAARMKGGSLFGKRELKKIHSLFMERLEKNRYSAQ